MLFSYLGNIQRSRLYYEKVCVKLGLFWKAVDIKSKETCSQAKESHCIPQIKQTQETNKYIKRLSLEIQGGWLWTSSALEHFTYIIWLKHRTGRGKKKRQLPCRRLIQWVNVGAFTELRNKHHESLCQGFSRSMCPACGLRGPLGQSAMQPEDSVDSCMSW